MIPLPEPVDDVWVTWRGERELLRAEDNYYTADKLRAHEAAVRAELLAVAKRRADHEAGAAAHHSRSWYEAYQYHLTRHSAMRDLIDAVWPDATTSPAAGLPHGDKVGPAAGVGDVELVGSSQSIPK